MSFVEHQNVEMLHGDTQVVVEVQEIVRPSIHPCWQGCRGLKPPSSHCINVRSYAPPTDEGNTRCMLMMKQYFRVIVKISFFQSKKSNGNPHATN